MSCIKAGNTTEGAVLRSEVHQCLVRPVLLVDGRIAVADCFDAPLHFQISVLGDVADDNSVFELIGKVGDPGV